MKNPIKKKVLKKKIQITPIQRARKVVDIVKALMVAHDKTHLAAMAKVSKAKANVAAKATAASKRALASARLRASVSRKKAAVLRESLQIAKSDFRSVKIKQKLAAIENAAENAILRVEQRLHAAQKTDLASAVKRFEARWLKARAELTAKRVKVLKKRAVIKIKTAEKYALARLRAEARKSGNFLDFIKKPAVKKPTVKKSIVKKPTVKKLKVVKPVAKRAIVSKLVVKKPVEKKPVTLKAAAKKTGSKKSSVKKVAVKKVAVKKAPTRAAKSKKS